MTSLNGEQKMMLSSKRGRLKFRARHQRRRTGVKISGPKFPGAQEIADIGGRDLGER